MRARGTTIAEDDGGRGGWCAGRKTLCGWVGLNWMWQGWGVSDGYMGLLYYLID